MGIHNPNSSLGTTKRNNGAVVYRGGNVDGTNVTNAPSFIGKGSKYGGVVPGPSANAGTHKALSGGTFAYIAENNYVIGRYTKTVSGVSNTLLQTMANHGLRPIYLTEFHRRYHITSWDYVTGAATKGGSAGAKTDYHDIVAGSGETPNDDAAHPTRAVPGEWVYMYHGTTTQKDYSAKNA